MNQQPDSITFAVLTHKVGYWEQTGTFQGTDAESLARAHLAKQLQSYPVKLVITETYERRDDKAK